MIKELVVSQEMGQKLKAAGWTRPTAFVWVKSTGGTWRLLLVEQAAALDTYAEWCYAPTAEEILREIPHQINHDGKLWWLAVDRDLSGIAFRVQYESFGEAHKPQVTRANSLSGAAAQMWLWCKAKGYIQ